MPYEEFINWHYYFSKRPVGWREDDRTMKFLQTQGVKEEPHEIFPSLKPIYAKEEESLVSALRKSSFFLKISGALGGDKIPE